MSRCFRLLGLTDKATKAQVEEAYRRRAARYKGPDYQEEPEYANRKLIELKGAYEEALRLARTGNSSSEIKRLKPSATQRTTSKVSSGSKSRTADYRDEDHGFGEKFHQWMEQRDDKKVHRKNKRTKDISGKSKSKADGKFTELKKLNPEHAKAAWQGFVSDVKGMVASLNLEDEHESSDSNHGQISVNSGEHLNREGTVEKTKKKSGGAEIISIIMSILVLGFTVFGSCGDDSISYEDEYDYQDEYGIEYTINDYDDYSEMDQMVKDMAEGSYDMLYGQTEFSSSSWHYETPGACAPQAEKFAQNYWGMENIDEVSDYLCNEFEGYTIDSSYELVDQLNGIFAFYGFMSTDQAQWFDQPYTNGRIQSCVQYLYYLNQYYEAEWE